MLLWNSLSLKREQLVKSVVFLALSACAGARLPFSQTIGVLRFPYVEGETRLAGPGTRVLELPAGPINHHWTKNVIASADGRKLYVTVGSNSNAAERGMDVEVDRASIWELDLATGAHRVYATGAAQPRRSRVGAAQRGVVDRGERARRARRRPGARLHDLGPRGAFYGWPYSYYGAHLDSRVTPQRPDLVATAIAPDYALGAHTACLGLASYGSWNRTPRSGYKVVYVAFEGGKPVGLPVDVLTGFLSEAGTASGSIWRVSASP